MAKQEGKGWRKASSSNKQAIGAGVSKQEEILALDYNEDIVRSKIKNYLVVDGRFEDKLDYF